MTEKAVLAAGCFWGVEDFFAKLKGVTHTRVGYTGGTKTNPTYEDLGDHSEAIEIEYDPWVITYQDLLNYFWREHNPTDSQKRQYQSAIFYLDDKQKQLAETGRMAEQRKYMKPILTEILPLGTFFPAEAYHQKYYAKLRALNGKN